MSDQWQYYVAIIAFVFSILGFNALDVACFTLSLIWMYVHTSIPEAQLKTTEAAAVPFASQEEKGASLEIEEAKYQAQQQLRHKRQTAWIILILSPASLYAGLYLLLSQPKDGYLCGLINLNFVVIGAVVRVVLKTNAASEASNRSLADQATVDGSILQTTQRELEDVKLVLTRQNADIAQLRDELEAYRHHLQNSIRVVSTVETDGRETEDYVFQLEERLRQLEGRQLVACNDSLWSTLTAIEWPHHKAGRLLRYAIRLVDPSAPTQLPKSPASLPWRPRKRTSSSSSAASDRMSLRSAPRKPPAYSASHLPSNGRYHLNPTDADNVAPLSTGADPTKTNARTRGRASATPRHRADRALLSPAVSPSPLLRD
eukprot:TRINITY_DN9931_c0_g2_i4.p1 TRINITY_DN9931_c0_g2~~TRINITY_DN9931_c0_g2_i4.p1  ORF type:complete len:373 (+),score=49.73 TRINITY_DN9931_c0_g2_i4:149-1267(+)